MIMRTDDEILNDAHAFVRQYKDTLNRGMNAIDSNNALEQRSVMNLNKDLVEKSMTLLNELAVLDKTAGWWRKKVIKNYVVDIVKARTLLMGIVGHIVDILD